MLKATAACSRAILPVSRAAFSSAAATVPMPLVKKLRESTGSPLMECRKALSAVLGENAALEDAAALDAAVEWLRKKGATLVASKSSRAAKEGVVAIAIAKDKSTGIVMEINCETDFVSRNTTFLAFAARASLAALETFPTVPAAGPADEAFNFLPADVAALSERPLPEGPAAMPASASSAQNNVSQELADVVNHTRENVKLRRAALVSVPAGKTGFVAGYVHNELPIPDELKPYLDTIAGQGFELKMGGSGALLTVTHAADASVDAELTDLSKKIAMQVVAGRPAYLARANVPASVVEKEREIIESTGATAGKPAEVVERLLAGKLNKFYEGAVLLDQQFLITNDTKKPLVSTLLAQHPAKPEIVQAAHFLRGEGAEDAEPEATA